MVLINCYYTDTFKILKGNLKSDFQKKLIFIYGISPNKFFRHNFFDQICMVGKTDIELLGIWSMTKTQIWLVHYEYCFLGLASSP
jgi:hypothetical protein